MLSSQYLRHARAASVGRKEPCRAAAAAVAEAAVVAAVAAAAAYARSCARTFVIQFKGMFRSP